MARLPVLASLVAAVLLGLLVAGRPANAPAQTGTPFVAAAEDFIGSWLVRVAGVPGQPEFVNVATFGADGTLVVSVPPVLPPGPGAAGPTFSSAGQGVWTSTSDEAAVVTFVGVQTDGTGRFLGTYEVRAALTVAADAASFSGPYTATFFAPDGAVTQSFSGTVEAKRIVAAPLGTPMPGTPAAGTPAA